MIAEPDDLLAHLLRHAVDEGRVILTKAKAAPVDDPFATFNEWDGEADRRAYGDL